MRLGILGGSFDPVHNGHLRIAQCAREQLLLDEVWFLPAASQPLKPLGPIASERQRLQMLQLAPEDQASFKAREIEYERGGVSYTVDTLQEIHEREPNAQLFFLMGADSLADFAKWKAPSEICNLAILAVVRRPDSTKLETARLDYSVLEQFTTPERIEQFRTAQVEMPPLAVSSSEIRRQIVAGGTEWQKDVPEKVVSYISTQRLYQRSQRS